MIAGLVNIKPLTELIQYTNSLHQQHSKNWTQNVEKPYNLKNKQIRHICSSVIDSTGQNIINLDTHFLEYMNDYCEELIPFTYDSELEKFDKYFLMHKRVKDPTSRVAKLKHYMSDKGEEGMVNLNKCLNDLFGIRVWIEGFDHSESAIEELKELVGIQPFRIYNASKGDYRATHGYFSNGKNTYFPWELQIWNPDDTARNFCSHSVHKQGYTKWVKDYIHLPLIEEVKKDV